MLASLLASVMLAIGWPVLADDRPTAAMLEPVKALVAFMAKRPAGQHPAMFAASGVTIIENYPPFVFAGNDAVVSWEVGFRKHAAEGRLTELAATFASAQDVDIAGPRAYFVLPTTWTGRAAGKPFTETGAWSFVLVPVGAGWKILAYGWGVTAHGEHAP